MSRVLFVGTDRTMTEMVGRLLKRNGFDVRCVIGREEAFSAIGAQSIAVVIADLEGSVTEGIRFCQEAKQRSTATRLLLISGNEKDEESVLLGGRGRLAEKTVQYADFVRAGAGFAAAGVELQCKRVGEYRPKPDRIDSLS